jgi:hypothetical protein
MWVITRNFFLLAVVFTPGLALATSYSPTAADIELDAGQSSAVSFTFFHNESSSQDYFVRLQSAQVGDGPDEVLFSEISTELASWVSLSDVAFSLAPGEVKEITLAVNVPSDAGSSVNVIALQVIERSQEDAIIGTSTGVSPLIFLSVGDLPGSAQLLDFNASKNLTAALPISFLVEIENTGLRFVQPEGKIVIRNLFGEVIEVLEVNSTSKRITAGVTRSFITDWGEASDGQGFFTALSHEVTNFTIGWVRVELVITPWEGGEEIQDSLTIFFFPWRTLLSFVIVIAILLGLLRLAKR